MKFRWLDVVLIIATLVGAYWAATTGRTVSALRAEYKRIVAIAGELEITDPSKLHIVALKTDEPFHFAWRVYLPANFPSRIRLSMDGSSGSSSFSNSRPDEFIARVRLGESRDGLLSTFQSFGNSSSFSTSGAENVFDFLKEHIDDLKIEQLGADGAQRLGPDDVAAMLKISLPEPLLVEARARFKNHFQTPTLIESRLGNGP